MAEQHPIALQRPGSIVIAVLTYRRTEDLRMVLPRLAEQAHSVSDAAAGTVRPQILVIDNDPAASGRSTVEAVAAAFKPGLITYIHEPKPGIAAARNRALAQSAFADLLIFIDDDEMPYGRWLAHLVNLQRATGASAVVGPVISDYQDEPDAWITAGRFFERRRLATGTPLTVAATNNLLLSVPKVRELNLEFDERFGLSGGSDTLFTRQLVRRGGTMLWCDEATVVDRVPTMRLTRGWVLRRALRSGNSAARVSLELERTAGRRLAARSASLISGLIRLAGGAGQMALGLLAGSTTHEARGFRTAARGLGMASGAFGYVYQEYKRM
ncbi:glycosyltransferase family 2 protein [Pseudarthrobacter sp. NPDC058362]|uniref:glycosyltransferase family 2 protein n=1 Tax=Pseudarthrobacter sp. NPDC058362 TaxID=3346458 RepID=UPI0036516946